MERETFSSCPLKLFIFNKMKRKSEKNYRQHFEGRKPHPSQLTESCQLAQPARCRFEGIRLHDRLLHIWSVQFYIGILANKKEMSNWKILMNTTFREIVVHEMNLLQRKFENCFVYRQNLDWKNLWNLFLDNLIRK